MVTTTPSTAATIPSPGNESAIVLKAATGNRPLMMDVHVEFHHLVDIERIHRPGGSHAQRIAHKAQHVMILGRMERR